jgi:hypothetical protein
LFYVPEGGNGDEEEGSEEANNERKTIAEQRQEDQEKAAQSLVWLNIIDTLSQGDVLKQNAVTELPLIQCFNKLVLDKSLPNSYNNQLLSKQFS